MHYRSMRQYDGDLKVQQPRRQLGVLIYSRDFFAALPYSTTTFASLMIFDHLVSSVLM